MDALPFSVKPFEDESGLSWLIRLAAENLLPSPWHLFRAVGVTQAKMTVLAFDPARFAPLAGMAPEQLRSLGFPAHRRRAPWVLFRGQAVGRNKFRNVVPQICPQCVANLGYARAIWDLRLSSACPQHRCRLIDRCNTCGNRLSWLRPRVGACRCGVGFSAEDAPPASEAAVAVSSLIQCMVERSTKAWVNDIGPANVAVEYLSTAPLAYGLALILRLARLADGQPRQDGTLDRPESAEAAGPVIMGWPTAFHGVLDAHLAKRRSKAGRLGGDENARTLRAALVERRTFHRIAAKHQTHDELAAPEIMRFVASRFQDACLDRRLCDQLVALGIDPRWIPHDEGARHLGIDPRTLDRLVASGAVRARRKMLAGQTRRFVLAEDLTPELAATKLVPFRAAVERTGLPAPVLKALRAAGEIGSTHQGPRSNVISQREIDALATRWSALSTIRMPAGTETISLHQALRLPLGRFSLGWKADLVERILHGTVAVYEVSSEPFLDAVLPKAEMMDLRLRTARERLTIGDVGTSLSIDKLGVLRLIVHGEIKADFSEPEIKVHRNQVAAFRKRFLRLTSVVGGSYQKATVLRKKCERARISLLEIEDGKRPATFVLRRDERRVRAMLRP